MTQTEMRLVKVLKEVTGKTEIADEVMLTNDFTDLGVNSLSFIKLVVAIEEEFDVEFEDSQINYELFGTVQSLAELLDEKMTEQSGA